MKNRYSISLTRVYVMVFLCTLWFAQVKSHAQTVTAVSTAYALAAVSPGASALAGGASLHVFFTLDGVQQIAAVELLIGTAQGQGDVLAYTFQLVQREGNYMLVGPIGETAVEGGRGHLVLPWSGTIAGGTHVVSVAAISTAQAKSAYAFGTIDK